MARTLRPISQHQYLVTIAGIEGNWATLEGGEEEFDSSEYTDPGDRRRKSVRGPLMVSNITLTKPYNPEQDRPLLEFWEEYRDNDSPQDITVTAQSITRDRERSQYGLPRTYVGCQIVRFVDPEVDIDSSDAAMIEVELTVDHLLRQ